MHAGEPALRGAGLALTAPDTVKANLLKRLTEPSTAKSRPCQVTVEQVDGLPQHYYAKIENPLPLSERIENADRFMTATGATIQHGGNRAFYAPGRDVVQLPPFEALRDKESYYATALHELTH